MNPRPLLFSLAVLATPAAVPKLKIKGVVTRRDADTFTVREMNGVDTR